MDPGPRDQTCISCNAADSTVESPGNPYICMKKVKMKVLVTQLSDSLQPYALQPTRYFCLWISPRKILEWVAIPFSREYS